MKYALAALLAAVSTPLYAHVGHVQEVAGHTHSISELVLMSAALAVIAVAGTVYSIARAKRLKK